MKNNCDNTIVATTGTARRRSINGIPVPEMVSGLSAILSEKLLTRQAIALRMQELGFGLGREFFKKTGEEMRLKIRQLLEKFEDYLDTSPVAHELNGEL